jgi:DNA-directed RNA polymerase subunit RPC12/RpoP
MRGEQGAQYQCMNCGHLHWIDDPPDTDEDKLYIKLKCKNCKKTANHLWVGENPEDLYLYYDLNKDYRYF